METLEIPKGSKTEIYEALLPQIQALIEGETDLYANLANVTAALKEAFNHFWVGFYLVKPKDLSDAGFTNSEGLLKEKVYSKLGAGIHEIAIIDEKFLKENFNLVLGPFQGPVACTRIAYGRGVCGTAWKDQKTLVVPDVDQFPGHIACSSLSKSEIVVPIFYKEQATATTKVVAVLDIDSDVTNSYDQTDAYYLEQLTSTLSQHFTFPK